MSEEDALWSEVKGGFFRIVDGEPDWLAPDYLNALEAKAALADEMAEALEGSGPGTVSELKRIEWWNRRNPLLARYHALQQEGTS